MFIDIEASGWIENDGYAIEIAWSDQLGKIHSFLINPEPLYNIDTRFKYWSFEAQKIHNINREMLLTDGLNPFYLVDYLNEQLKDKTLYSDAPIYDIEWIDVIYKACSIERNWKIKNASILWYDLFGSFYVNYIPYYEKILADEGIIHTHRAADDVRLMLEIYKKGLN